MSRLRYGWEMVKSDRETNSYSSIIIKDVHWSPVKNVLWSYEMDAHTYKYFDVIKSAPDSKVDVSFDAYKCLVDHVSVTIFQEIKWK